MFQTEAVLVCDFQKGHFTLCSLSLTPPFTFKQPSDSDANTQRNSTDEVLT